MDLRNLPNNLDGAAQANERRKRIEQELKLDLTDARVDETRIGSSNEKNCEQMFGHVLIPVGLAGPLKINNRSDVYIPLATTEGALVASVNRGCKAASVNGIHVSSIQHGISRSIAIKQSKNLRSAIEEKHSEWKNIGESTSDHLKILSFDIDETKHHLFLTINCDTDKAMGMNMTTIAAQAIAECLQSNLGAKIITIAANVDSDKKPSKRTHEKGRGYEAIATCDVSNDTITSILKTSPEKILETYQAKLIEGSQLTGAIASNSHAANIIAAIYIATGQDAAHVVEGSLADTTIESTNDGIKISVRCPAVLIGTIGGGTTLPSQAACRSIMKIETPKQFAEIIAAAVLAGELSLLAALSSQDLAGAHKKLAR